MKARFQKIDSFLKILIGCFMFGLGFNLFLTPNGLNAGGISGLAMVVVHLTGFTTIGTMTMLMNLPLFIISGVKIGKKFLIASLIGMFFSSIAIDILSVIPTPTTEPLVGCLYGGVTCGLGLGLVFSQGGSTGGSDIIVRLLKLKWQHVPIGIISSGFDLAVAILTGIVFQDLSRTLYSGIAVFICGQVIDAVVYRFDYSKVALIVSDLHEQIADAVSEKLDRGVTYLYGEGYYSGQEKKVILTAVKKAQIAELKQSVSEIDPNAFIIVQEAHQVLGDGFSRYTKDSL